MSGNLIRGERVFPHGSAHGSGGCVQLLGDGSIGSYGSLGDGAHYVVDAVLEGSYFGVGFLVIHCGLWCMVREEKEQEHNYLHRGP